MLPGILNQLGADSLTHLKRLASAVPGMGGAAGMLMGLSLHRRNSAAFVVSYTVSICRCLTISCLRDKGALTLTSFT